MTTSERMPPALTAELARAAAAIDDDGELPAPERGRMHRTIDDAARRIHPNAARYVRAKLALTCAQASLVHVNGSAELRAESEALLSAIAAAMRGDLDADTLETLHDSAAARTDDLLLSGSVDPRTAYALRAGVAAASTLLYDPEPDELGTPELESDPTDWEACFFTSLAATGGAVWDGIGDAVERRRFWEWYLAVAVPHAWDPHTPLIGEAS
ncbi:Imm5 family immunity protein [Agromyces sp. MMS24-K17]|uniref:Imm5 family immunity protein n=1 Tax=Agromyces sp. MMS24-K17 TaxID=3372850 RepID=UPI0037540765